MINSKAEDISTILSAMEETMQDLRRACGELLRQDIYTSCTCGSLSKNPLAHTITCSFSNHVHEPLPMTHFDTTIGSYAECRCGAKIRPTWSVLDDKD